jgi:hypothetical protein
VDGCGNSRGARWAEPLTKSRSAGASKPSGAIFLSPHWRMGARSDSLCARSLPGFRVGNGPIFTHFRQNGEPPNDGSRASNEIFPMGTFSPTWPAPSHHQVAVEKSDNDESICWGVVVVARHCAWRHLLARCRRGRRARRTRGCPRRRARGATRAGPRRARHRASRPVEAAARGRATAETRARRRASRRSVFRSGDRGRGTARLPLARAGGRARAARNSPTGT